MNEIILSEVLSNKNKRLIVIYIILIALIFTIPLPFNESIIDLSFNQEYYIIQYNELIIEFLKLLLPIIYLIILSDHDLRFLNSLSPYLGRSKIIISKLFIYLYLNIINILIIISFYFLIPKIFGFSFLNQNNYLNSFISLLTDSFIITLLIILFNRNYQKLYSYLIITCYIIINFIYAFEVNIIVYYLLPFYRDLFSNYQYTYIYQLTYILLLVILNYLKYLNEDFK